MDEQNIPNPQPYPQSPPPLPQPVPEYMQAPSTSPVNSNQSPTPPVPPTPDLKPKGNVWLILFLTLIFILSLGFSGYLYLQNAQIKKELEDKKLERPVPVYTPLPTEQPVLYTPSASPSASPLVKSSPSPNPTSNWKTYSNDQYKFVFKYPNDWRVISSEQEAKPQDIAVTYDPDTKDSYLERNPGAFDQSQKSDTVINGVQITRIENNKDVYRREYAIIPLTNGTLIITATLDLAANQKQISSFDQILSTFKFISQ